MLRSFLSCLFLNVVPTLLYSFYPVCVALLLHWQLIRFLLSFQTEESLFIWGGVGVGSFTFISSKINPMVFPPGCHPPFLSSFDCSRASPTQWTWVWVSSGSWGWTGKPGVLQSMGSQRVGTTERLNWTEGEPSWGVDLGLLFFSKPVKLVAGVFLLPPTFNVLYFHLVKNTF